MVNRQIYYPDKKEFIKLSKKGNLIPVYREMVADFETPLSAFTKIAELDKKGRASFSYLLESVEGGERIGRYSFLGGNPSLVFMSKGKRITIIEEGENKNSFCTEKDPLFEIKNIMDKFRFVPVKGLPRFCGGLVGYIGYDMIRFFEDVPDENTDDLNLPDSLFVLTDTILIFDHVDRKIKIVSNAYIQKQNSLSIAYEKAIKKIEEIRKLLSQPIKRKKAKHTPSARHARIRSNFSKKDFVNIVRKAKKYIKNGDIIQTVLSQRFETKISCSVFDIYRALRTINPSPYMFYLNFGTLKLVGSSPEIMVRCEDGHVELRPIAGTRPRGTDEREDAVLMNELLNDPKERAEHIMLVDLGRNDLGRVCEFKSIGLPEFMVIEKYSHVMHIVSDVRGRLKSDKDIYDVIRASFPAGTVTGAPKIRAMEIIDELENVRRGPYAGCIGYFSFSGNLDTCITIRTLIAKDDRVYIQAGAGIVADSKPGMEYQETVNKARALIKAIEMAESGMDRL